VLVLVLVLVLVGVGCDRLETGKHTPGRFFAEGFNTKAPSSPRKCHPEKDIVLPASGIRHPASGIRHPASGIRHPASGIRHPSILGGLSSSSLAFHSGIS